MQIVLVEIDNGDGVEAEAFKTIESFREYIVDTFEDRSDKMIGQLDEQLDNGDDVVDLEDDYGVTIRAYTKFTIY